MKTKISSKTISLTFGIIVFLFLMVFYVSAWTGPGQAPPGCTTGQPGCDAPINSGASIQAMSGTLVVNGALLEAHNSAYLATLGGSVGIGDSSPASLLTVGNGDKFQVNSSGNLIKVNNVTYSWPGAQGGANTVLTNNGAGTLSWAAAGGGGIGGSGAANYIAKFTAPTTLDYSQIYESTGKIGVGTTIPQSLLTVGSTGYFQFLKTFSGAPPAADCDDNTELGRMTLDISNFRLYICVGLYGLRYWDYISLTN